jgi:predicted membrane protein
LIDFLLFNLCIYIIFGIYIFLAKVKHRKKKEKDKEIRRKDEERKEIIEEREEKEKYEEIKSKNDEKKEIIVVDHFLIENGILGLDRDCFLSLVKFLDSSTVRKV